MKEFKDTIQKYLQERAAEDLLFAPRLANPKKSIDECCRYILGEARKRGTSVVMSDTEVFGTNLQTMERILRNVALLNIKV